MSRHAAPQPAAPAKPASLTPPFLAHWLLPPLAAVAVLAVIGALGLAADDAWLVPSLGSAILVQVMTPDQPAGRLWNSGIGQLVAIAAGFAGIYLADAAAAPPFMSGHPLDAARLLAMAIAVAGTVLLQRALKATSPAGGAVALLVALGTVPPTAHGALLLTVGILLVTGLGEFARVAILRAEHAKP